MTSPSSFEKKIFKRVDGLLSDMPKTKIIAVAVSGGADSMALALVLQKWAVKKRKRLIALHVDHGLRPESKAEAKQVKKWLRTRKINCDVLVWRGQKPNTRIHEKARAARYDLFARAMKKHRTPCLFLAHHLYDQAETVVLRWARKSGLDGLSGMQNITQQKGIYLLRPLLNVKPAVLRQYLRKQKQDWLEDPSNLNPKYTRARIRGNQKILTAIGLKPEFFAAIANSLKNVRHFYQTRVEEFIFTHTFTVGRLIVIERKAYHQLDKEVARRVIQKCLMMLSPRAYPPRGDAILRVIETMGDQKIQTKRTLQGCVIHLRKDVIEIYTEKQRRTRLLS